MRRRIVVSLLFLFAVFAAGAGVASWYVNTATKELQHLLSLHEVEGLRRNLVISVQSVQADLYTVHTPLERRLDSIVQNVEQLDVGAEECASCHHGPAVERDLDEILTLVDRYKTALSYYITASADRAQVARLELEAAAIGDQLLARTGRMSAVATETLDEITRRAAARVTDVMVILFATVGVSFLIGIAISSYLVRLVTKPVQRLVGATRIIASGNLQHRIEDSGRTEFGELGRHFNAMSAALEESYAGLRSTNEELTREVSDRKRAEEEREALQSQLLHAQKMEALGTISVGIAHEFGNFLQIIQACVERLSSKIGAGNAAPPEFGMIENTVQRGSDLARSLLKFGAKTRSEPLPIDINERLSNVKAILDRTLPKTIAIELDLAESLSAIRADPTEVEQVLMNLAVNARDAMPDGGVLRMKTRRVPRADASTGQKGENEPAEWVVLSVEDTGHGISPETAKQIFDPFFTTKEVGAGTGLGLAVVYGIVVGCGGQISCTSKVGQGTRFEIRLPGLPGEVVAARPEAAQHEDVGPGSGRILLVDDEVIMLDVTRQNLEEYGYRIHTAESGEEAVEFFRHHGDEIDLVILDLGMPGMGGRACLEKILEVRPGTKIIVSSGYSTDRDRDDVLAAGASGFLPKPSRVPAIHSKIKEVMSG